MGAFEYTALDTARPRTARAWSKATPSSTCASCCASGSCCRSPSPRSSTEKPSAQRGVLAAGAVSRPPTCRCSRASSRRWCKRRPAARGSAARGLAAVREATRPEHHARGARQGHGRPHAGRRLQRISQGVPRDLSLDGIRGRELRTSRWRARAPRRLHREPRGHAAEGARRDALSDRACRSSASAS